MMYTAHKKILNNGLRVVTIPMENTQAITAFLFIGTGSHYEQEQMSGLSHYLEHLFFKGSKNYKTPYDISIALDSIGAHYNAYTSEEWTAFYVKTIQENIEKGLDVMSDFLQHPLFTDQEIEREKYVILEELNMYLDNPSRRVIHNLMTALYGDQPAGRDIGGTHETVQATQKQDVVDYFEKQYRTENMALVFAGNVDKEQGVMLAEKYFSHLSTGAHEIQKDKVHNLNPEQPTVHIDEKHTDQTSLAIAFPAYSLQDPQRYTLSVLATILGGGMSSRLFTEVREKKGLCYAIHSSTEVGTDYGFFYVQSGIAKQKTHDAVQTIVSIFKDIKENGVTQSEVDKAKNIKQARLLLGLEASDSVAEYWGTQEILKNEVETPEQYLEQINNVNIDNIQQVANDVFKQNQVRLALVSQEHTNKESELSDLFSNL